MLPYSERAMESLLLPYGQNFLNNQSRPRFLSTCEYFTPNYDQNILFQFNNVQVIPPAPTQNYNHNLAFPPTSNRNENYFLFSQKSPSVSISQESLRSTTNYAHNQQSSFTQNICTTLPTKTNEIIDDQMKSVGRKVIERKLLASQCFLDRKQSKKNEKNLIDIQNIQNIKEESKPSKPNKVILKKYLHLNLKLIVKQPLEIFKLNTNLSQNKKINKTNDGGKLKKSVIGLISCCDEFLSDDEVEIKKPYQSKIMKKREFDIPKTERAQDIEGKDLKFLKDFKDVKDLQDLQDVKNVKNLKNISIEIEKNNKFINKDKENKENMAKKPNIPNVKNSEKMEKKENKEILENVSPNIEGSNSSESKSKIENSSQSNYSIDVTSPNNFSKAVTKVEAKFSNFEFSRQQSGFKNIDELEKLKKYSDPKLDRIVHENSPPQEMLKLGEI